MTSPRGILSQMLPHISGSNGQEIVQVDDQEFTYNPIDFEMIFRTIFATVLLSGMVYMMETAIEVPRDRNRTSSTVA